MTKEFDPKQLATRIKRFREGMGLSLKAFAQKAGVSKNTVVNAEEGKRIPRITNIERLADALDVDLVELIDPALREGLDYKVIRASKREGGISISTLLNNIEKGITSDLKGGTPSTNILNISPEDGEQTICHEGNEILYCLEGDIIVTLFGEKEVTLSEGEYIKLFGDDPHSYKSERDAVGLSVITKPERRAKTSPKTTPDEMSL